MCGKWSIPTSASGGDYKIVASYPRYPGLVEAARNFTILAFSTPRLSITIDLKHSAFGAGEVVAGNVKVWPYPFPSLILQVSRAEGGAARGAQVIFTSNVDSSTVWQTSTSLDQQGEVSFSFPLPVLINNVSICFAHSRNSFQENSASISVTVLDGGVIESRTKTIPIVAKMLDISFFPEGGDLALDVPNR